MVKLVIQISKGIIRDQRTRRAAMFYGVLIALIMLFVGAVILDGWLREHVWPWLFLLWWAGCAWLTLLAVLLAVFDMIVLRAASRRARHRLEQHLVHKPRDSDHDDAA